MLSYSLRTMLTTEIIRYYYNNNDNKRKKEREREREKERGEDDEVWPVKVGIEATV